MSARLPSNSSSPRSSSEVTCRRVARRQRTMTPIGRGISRWSWALPPGSPAPLCWVSPGRCSNRSTRRSCSSSARCYWPLLRRTVPGGARPHVPRSARARHLGGRTVRDRCAPSRMSSESGSADLRQHPRCCRSFSGRSRPAQPRGLLAAFFACCAWALFIAAHRARRGARSATRSCDRAEPDRVGSSSGCPSSSGAWLLVSKEASWMASSRRGAIRPALTGLLLGLSVASISADPLESLLFTALGPAGFTNWLALWPLLDIGPRARDDAARVPAATSSAHRRWHRGSRSRMRVGSISLRA